MPEGNYYTDLADAMRLAATKCETLATAGVRPPSSITNLYLAVSHVPSDADNSVPVVEAIAAAFGIKPTMKIEGRGSLRRAERRADVDLGALRVHAYAAIPAPKTRAEKLDELRRENDELRAQLASQGGVL